MPVARKTMAEERRSEMSNMSTTAEQGASAPLEDTRLTDTASRDHLVEALQADLIGPYEEGAEEILSVSPFRWYLTGFLAPTNARQNNDPDDDDDKGAGDLEGDDDDVEDEVSRRDIFAASCGMTFLLPDEDATLEVDVRYADYELLRGKDLADALANDTERQADDDALRAQPNEVREELERQRAGQSAQERSFWRRVPVECPRVRIHLQGTGNQEEPLPSDPELILSVRCARTTLLDGTPARAVSIFLVNQRDPEQGGDRRQIAASFIYQVAMEVRTNPQPLALQDARDASSDEDEARIADLQYRDIKSYAKGHNLAVEHRTEEGELGEHIVLRTNWLPQSGAGFVKARELDPVNVDMEALGQCTDAAQIGAALDGLVPAYREWIEKQRQLSFNKGEHATTRDQLMRSADEAASRIEAGIALLKNDATLRRAFALTNQAMALSARRREGFRKLAGQKTKHKQRQEAVEAADPPSWRLFQLAFLLMNIAPTLRTAKGGSAGTKSFDEVVDLLYFPTGGGKTEAYFGVAAFTMVLRRLLGRTRDDGGDGVAVLLRYTLRLLTLDQLERAAMLICALDDLRAESVEELGQTPFRVGLWVGRSSSANTVKEAFKAINEAKGEIGSPDAVFPLKRCPACGEVIESRCFLKDDKSAAFERVNVYCSDRHCRFSQRKATGVPGNYGIPVEFIDEQIYRFLPTFLIGTVDKFAMIPYRDQAGKLFGKASARHKDGSFFAPHEEDAVSSASLQALPDGLLPPELIIQDEVHLIAGPLGSMVGAYEAMVEELCTLEEGGGSRRPRIVASTATARRAGQQMRRLFGRAETAIFPPYGTRADDNFFAVPDESRPERLYVGVAATGRATKKVLKRVYTTLLGAAQWNVVNRKGDARNDAYLSLVGYFNALRELGGMRMIVDDEVFSSLKSIEARVPANRENEPHRYFARRELNEVRELTSRVGTKAVAETRDRLSQPFRGKKGIDVVLASNMISVGIDIERLGLMVMSGQPKTTSEYIQATSRVGRRHPGLVVTAYNIHRARDRSHYEDFGAYHSAFYRRVESMSLTPFALPALERAFHGVFIGLLRHLDGRYAADSALLDAVADAGLRARVADALHRRVDMMLDPTTAREIQDRIGHLGDRLITDIDRIRAAGGNPWYGPFVKGKRPARYLLEPTPQSGERMPQQPDSRYAPTSMRDVEMTAPIWVDMPPNEAAERPER